MPVGASMVGGRHTFNAVPDDRPKSLIHHPANLPGFGSGIHVTSRESISHWLRVDSSFVQPPLEISRSFFGNSVTSSKFCKRNSFSSTE